MLAARLYSRLTDQPRWSLMFRRKKVELEEDKPAMETSDELGIPGKPGIRQGGLLGSGKPPVMPARAAEPARTEIRPAIEMPRRPETPPAVVPPASVAAPPPARRADTEHRKLTVGREIAL